MIAASMSDYEPPIDSVSMNVLTLCRLREVDKQETILQRRPMIRTLTTVIVAVDEPLPLGWSFAGMPVNVTNTVDPKTIVFTRHGILVGRITIEGMPE